MAIEYSPSNSQSSSTIEDVRNFWHNNPLWTGESDLPLGSKEFFEEHRRVVIEDGTVGVLDPRIFPTAANRKSVLDLGCGPGFWLVELWERGCQKLTAADLTQPALELARRRCEIYGVIAEFKIQNAEAMTFKDGEFSHVNCQGVIHHSPNTLSCIQEIARVLEPGGSASISVYYKNFFLRNWSSLNWIGKIFFAIGSRLKGRGREQIFKTSDVNEIVRLYDGAQNPVGKAYSQKEFEEMLKPYFEIEHVFFHFFPARSLPFKIPRFLHRFLDQNLPFMIYVFLRKKNT